MKIGTKSILIGAHCFFLHPFFVAWAWWQLYGFPFDLRLWVAFFVHDLGYVGKPNMDGAEGEEHPRFGAFIMGLLFGDRWYDFTLYHSRFLAKKHGSPYSKLCVADKLAIKLTWQWLYLFCTNVTGEIHEYMKGTAARTPAGERSQREWLTDVQNYCEAWAWEHRDLKQDFWTGTKRDLADSNLRSSAKSADTIA